MDEICRTFPSGLADSVNVFLFSTVLESELLRFNNFGKVITAGI